MFFKIKLLKIEARRVYKQYKRKADYSSAGLLINDYISVGELTRLAEKFDAIMDRLNTLGELVSSQRLSDRHK